MFKLLRFVYFTEDTSQLLLDEPRTLSICARARDFDDNRTCANDSNKLPCRRIQGPISSIKFVRYNNLNCAYVVF